VNDQLSEIAQRWANEMARTSKLEHSPAELRNYGRQTLGENFTARFKRELTREISLIDRFFSFLKLNFERF